MHAVLSVLAVAGALFAYAGLAHWAAVSQSGALAAAFTLGPVLLVGAVLAVRAWRLLGLCLVLAAAALMYFLAVRSSAPHLQVLLPIPSIAVNLLLLWIFAHTLRPGHEAIVTRMARHVHGDIPLDIEAHTRHVTWAWSIFFALMAAASLLLFIFASRETWSLFANVLTLPLAALLFVAEYVYRLLRYPNFSHASLLAGVRAFRNVKRGFLLDQRESAASLSCGCL
jgi:uncharacterized membrane protein